MCLLCVEIQKGMTFKEVMRAIGEFIPPKDHESELMTVIEDKYPTELAELAEQISISQSSFGYGGDWE